MATQVEILMSSSGNIQAGPGAGPGGGTPSADQRGAGGEKKKKNMAEASTAEGFKELGNRLAGAKKFFSKNLGLNFGISSMLKQSQIFTSFIGVIFQLVGALVDVLLAPLIPIFFPVLRILGGLIPKVQTFMAAIGPWVGAQLNKVLQVWNNLKAWWDTEWKTLKDAWSEGPTALAEAVWNLVWVGLEATMKAVDDSLRWLWESVSGLALWNSAYSWLEGPGGRIAGWFTQAYLMFGQVQTAVDNILGWTGKLVAKLLTGTWDNLVKFGGWVAKIALPWIVGAMGNKIATALKIFMPGIGHIVVWSAELLGHLFKFLMGLLAEASRFLWDLGKQGVNWMITKIKGFFSEAFNKVLDKLRNIKLPFVGKVFEKMERLAGPVIKKIGEKGIGGSLMSVAKLSKAIPFVGAIATGAFGAVETYKMYKEHGWQAGLATATKTVAATTLAGFGQTYASLAVDMGGTLLIDQAIKLAERNAKADATRRNMEGQQPGSGREESLVVKFVTADGMTVQEEIIAQSVATEEQGITLARNLTIGGTP